METIKKIFFQMIPKLFFGLIFIVGLYGIGLISGSIAGRVIAVVMAFIALGISLLLKTVRGNILYIPLSGAVLGGIVGSIAWLFFNFEIGAILTIIFCLIFSAKYLGKKISELLAEIKNIFENIRESIF